MYGQRPPDIEPIYQLADLAEQSGLHSIWVGDSLVAKPRLEPIVTLAALASRTHRIRLGTAVLLAGMRQPVLLAHAVATLDVISSGRMTLAIGVGGVFNESQRHEWLAAGINPRERAHRIEELSQSLKNLWTQDNVCYSGKYLTLENVTLEPKPVQTGGVPLLLACHFHSGSDAQYRRAAHYGDGFISITDTPEEFSQVHQRITSYVMEEGRDPSSLDSVYYMTVNINQNETKAREEAREYITRYYGKDFWKDRWGPYGPPEVLSKRIREFGNAGAKTIIIRFASNKPISQFHALIEKVLPALQT
jgi:alkanesulfonate monooxygenase SsuD/methylene tetrahydromethanopterin reductase-like flavin-dependent oxidoreductase (luciferase family)